MTQPDTLTHTKKLITSHWCRKSQVDIPFVLKKLIIRYSESKSLKLAIFFNECMINFSMNGSMMLLNDE